MFAVRMQPRFVFVFFVAIIGSALAQTSSYTITANPKARTLHHVWMLQGGFVFGDGVGSAGGSAGDVSGDSIGDFAVLVERRQQWRIYRGGSPPDTTLYWMLDSAGGIFKHPVSADFYGNGSHTVVFDRYRHELINGITEVYGICHFFRVGPTGIEQKSFDTIRFQAMWDMQARNLDGRPGDEFILLRKDSIGQIANILFYKGGPDFQVKQPTAIFRDNEESLDDHYFANFGDFDHDGHQDMLLSGLYGAKGDTAKLKFFFGDDNSPWSWTTRGPDRVIVQKNGIIGVNVPPMMADLDGDGSPDLYGIVYLGADTGTYVYLSGGEKNIRTRSLRLEDADVAIRSGKYLGLPVQFGSLNDSLRRYQMLGIGTLGEVYLFSGGPHGPDGSYEAWYRPSADDVPDGIIFDRGSGNLGDVTGTGWDSFLAASSRWGTSRGEGIALVVSGGPDIPRDFVSEVHEVVLEGKHKGLSIWPNPASEELHIGWRGDLMRMPERFEGYNALGEHVASGRVDPWRGEALWRMEDLPAGVYLLAVYDRNGYLLATTTVVRE